MVLVVLVGCSEEITAVVEVAVEPEPSTPDKIPWGKDGQEKALNTAGRLEEGAYKKEHAG